MPSKSLRIIVSLFAFISGMMLVLEHRDDDRFTKERKEFSEERTLEASYALESMRWYNDQRAYPSGVIPVGWKQKALQHIQTYNLAKSSSATAVAWNAVGPDNIGGRVRSVAIDPSNSNIIYCGSVSGGVWKSTNAGAAWFPTNDFATNLVIGAIAIDPTNSNIIYAGTGEGFFNIDALRGEGVLKSTNGGTSWILLTDFPSANSTYGYHYITDLVIRPGTPSTLYASMIGGIWKSTNSGTNWSKLTVSGSTIYCTELAVHPTGPDTMYAAFGLLNITDGIYKSTNGGTNWAKLGGGLPTTGYGRISLGMAPGNPRIIYAVYCDATSYDTYNIYKTTNGGTSWSTLTKPNDGSMGTSHLGNQGWYNNTIAIHPTRPDTVIIGGINLFRTFNGGSTWTMISDGLTSLAPFVHVDQHAIVYDPANSTIIYFGNDGGMYKSSTGGSSFSAINNQLAITQFYSVALHPTAEIYYGGTQDNGTLKVGTAPAWSTVFGGDGGATAVDFTTPATVYTEYVFLDILKSTNSGTSWSKSMSGIPTSGPNLGDGTSDRCLFIAPLVMDPSNSQTLLAGTFKVYRTTTGGSSWSGISADLTGDGDGTGQVGSHSSVISALAIAKSASATIYAGTSGSASTGTVAKLQVTTNTGSSWTPITGTLPNRYVTSIGIDPANRDRAFVTFSGYGTGHIYLTTNRGVSWTDISGTLPDIPANKVLIDPVNVNHIFIGTDLGVFEGIVSGTTAVWTQRNTGLANVSVSDLDIRDDFYLFAATHGRGMFKSTLPVGVQDDKNPALPSEFILKQNYPNPFNPSTTISFSVANRSHVRLIVYDALGKEIKTLIDGETFPGDHTVEFEGGAYASGVYFYRLQAGAFSVTKKMLLVR